jgi:hypothetical protein
VGLPLAKNIDRLYHKIEIKREKLHHLLRVYQDFTHPQVVNLSQELDKLLNIFDTKNTSKQDKNRTIQAK